MSAFLNVSSICLGLLSWVIPALSLKYKQCHLNSPGLSLLCCALSLLLQLFEIRHRVGIGDLAAVMDTIQVVTLAGSAMLAVCLIINAIVFFRRTK